MGQDSADPGGWWDRVQHGFAHLGRTVESTAHTIHSRVSVGEVQHAVTTSSVAAVGGFVLGGLASCQATAARHIEENKSTRYRSQFHAQRELNDVVAREFARVGLRTGLKTGLFVGVFSVTMLALEKWRERRDAGNAIAGGALAGAVLSVPKGPVGMGRGMLLGGSVSVVYGLLLQALWTLEDAAATDEVATRLGETHVNTASLPTDTNQSSAVSAVDRMLDAYDQQTEALQREYSVSDGTTLVVPRLHSSIRWQEASGEPVDMAVDAADGTSTAVPKGAHALRSSSN